MSYKLFPNITFIIKELDADSGTISKPYQWSWPTDIDLASLEDIAATLTPDEQIIYAAGEYEEREAITAIKDPQRALSNFIDEVFDGKYRDNF